jgi:DNA-binding transcriptional regulator YiaG
MNTPKHPTSAEFANLLRAWRADNEFSQRDAAQVLGINKRTLENWEQERAMITGYGLQQLLRKLHQKRIKLPRL